MEDTAERAYQVKYADKYEQQCVCQDYTNLKYCICEDED